MILLKSQEEIEQIRKSSLLVGRTLAEVGKHIKPGVTTAFLDKIANKYEVGLSEIKNANTHIKNPDLIYPGDILTIPAVDTMVIQYEKRVVELVNAEREKKD